MSLFKKALPFLTGGMIGGQLMSAKNGGLLGTQQKDQTTTTAPWEPQQGYLKDIFQQGQNLYNANPGGMNQATQMGINALMQPDQNIQQGAGLLGRTMNGDFLNSNPYLDQTFNQAASSVGNNIASRFAGSGRFGSGAMYNSLNSGMNNLANDIYGGNYQMERNRQMQAAQMAPSFANFDANRYLQAGQLQQQAPWEQLAKYQGAVSGNYGGTSTSPMYRNATAGLLGGALAGAQLGSALPGLGTGLGAFGGGLLGMIG